MKKQNIVLVGFYGSGKKKFGKEVARVLDLPFADLDEQLQFILGSSVQDFAEKHGWQVLREIEQRVTHDFCRNFSGIIAAGSNTIENSKNLQNLKKTGFFVYLNPNFMILRKHLMGEGGSELPEQRINPDQPLHQEIEQLWNQRKMIYSSTGDSEAKVDLHGDVAEQAKMIIDSIPKHIRPDAPLAKKIVIFTNKDTSDLATKILDIKNNSGRVPNLHIAAIISTQPGKAPKGIDAWEHINPKDFESTEERDRELVNILRDYTPDWILMDGWENTFSSLYKEQFGEFTLGTHHSLLPEYKEFDGTALYEQPLENGDKYSGCTFYRVAPTPTSGEILLQRKVLIDEGEQVDTLKQKIEKQELLGFAEILERK